MAKLCGEHAIVIGAGIGGLAAAAALSSHFAASYGAGTRRDRQRIADQARDTSFPPAAWAADGRIAGAVQDFSEL